MDNIQRPSILKVGETYTLRKYFELEFAPGDILRELGANLIKTGIDLPTSKNEITRLGDLKQRYTHTDTDTNTDTDIHTHKIGRAHV